METRKLLIAALAMLPMAAFAQFDFGGGASAPPQNNKPWASFKLPKKSIKLDFRNANVDMVLSLFQTTSGVTIVKDPSLVDRMTITSAKAVPIADAFQILSTTLSLKGYDMSKEGNLLVIKKRDPKQQQPQMPAFDPSMFAGMQTPQSELRVYPVQFASASALARVLNDIYQSGGGGLGGFSFPGAITFGGAAGGRGGQANRFGGFGGASPFGRGNSAPSVRASADDFSNSLVVNAPRDQHREVADLIKQLDKQTDAPQRPVVYKLEFASASEVATSVQTVLTANAPKGRGQTTQQQPTGFAALFGGGNRQNQNVTADTRSNTIIVTATDENHALVKNIVAELDKEIPIQASTVVIPLENARADDVAGLLNQAFGQRQGTGQNRGGTQNRNTGTQNRNNQNRNQGGGGLGGNNANPNDLMLEFQDPNADEGELLTTVGVAGQFGFFGGGQQQNQNNQNRNNQTARDSSGRIVNVQDLTGQVTTIADPNTNSIIVVTTPQGADLIKNIIGQLDRIPEQVMIETMIVEASLDESTKLGFDWTFSQVKAFGQNGVTGNASTRFPETGTNATQQNGFRYTVVGGNLDLVLNALKTDDRFQVLSTPRIFTSNNVEAQINISQSVPYVTNSRQDANGNFTFNYAFEDVGIVLTVTPRITSNGYVTMVVSQTANDLQGYTDFNAPIINQRQADTTVSVKDSETIVLGGIIRSTVTSNVRKVPLLGDIPLLGELFRSTTKGKQKTELIVFLTPRVVKDADDARLLRDRVKGQLSPGQQKQIDRELGKITPNSTKPVEKTKGEAKPGGTTSDPNKTGKGGQ